MPKFRVPRKTALVVTNWIRNNYKGLYPSCLEKLSAKYITSLHEGWLADKSLANVILVSFNVKCATRLNDCKSISWAAYRERIYGFIRASTFKGNHEWILRINAWKEQLTIGLNEFSDDEKCHEFALHNDPHYGFDNILSVYLESDFTVHYAEEYDELYIRLHKVDNNKKSKLEFIIVRDKEPLLKSKMMRIIPAGIYQLNAALYNNGDSITLEKYSQPEIFKKLTCTRKRSTKKRAPKSDWVSNWY